MKIGMTCHPTIGGSGMLATTLGIELARRGHEIHFINYEYPVLLKKQKFKNVFFHKIKLVRYPVFKYLPYDTALLSREIELIKSLQLDILHAHYAIPFAVSSYLAKLVSMQSHVKVIATLHGTDITYLAKDVSYAEIMKIVLEKLDGLTAVSNYLKEQCSDIVKLQRDIKVIHNFIDTDYFSPNKNLKFRIKYAQPEEKIILHVSNMRPLKRICDIVSAFYEVQRYIPCRLLLVGQGPELYKAKALSHKLKIFEKVRFLGNRINRVPILNSADVFVLPSETEGFGLSALEAMSCGVPCIVTNHGGTSELVRDQVDGFLIEPGDIEDIASKILLILTEEKLQSNMGIQARARAIESFSTDSIINEYEKFYKEMLEEKK